MKSIWFLAQNDSFIWFLQPSSVPCNREVVSNLPTFSVLLIRNPFIEKVVTPFFKEQIEYQWHVSRDSKLDLGSVLEGFKAYLEGVQYLKFQFLTSSLFEAIFSVELKL